MDWIWDSAWAWVQSNFHLVISPFWYWVFVGACACAFMTLLAFFFSPLRPLAGAVFLAVIAGLTGYQRGRYDKIREQKTQAKKPAPKPDQWKRW